MKLERNIGIPNTYILIRYSNGLLHTVFVQIRFIIILSRLLLLLEIL